LYSIHDAAETEPFNKGVDMFETIRRSPWLALFPLTALISAIIAIWAAYNAIEVTREWKSATGTVVDLESGSKGGFFPVITFSVGGQSYHFRSNNGSNPAPYAIGESVPILYDPTDPDHATIDSFTGRYLGVIIGGGLAIVFALAGWLAGKLMRSSQQPMRPSNTSDRWVVYLSIVFIGVGVICGTIGTFIYLNQHEAETVWIRTRGEVIDFWHVRGTTSQSTVRYTARDGVSYTAVLNIDSWSEYTPGETVEVAYNPKRPGDAMLAEEIGLGFVFWLMAFFALIFTGVGVVVYVVLYRNSHNTKA
jgi:hypothetical protein